jgi:hypothetical protein
MTNSRDDQQNSLLSEGQHRALSTRLALLDHRLSEAAALLAGRCHEGVMFEITSDLTPEQTETLLALISEARSHIRSLRDRLGLAVQYQDIRRWLVSSFGILWTILEDSHAAKLRGFGGVSPDLAAQLDPELDRLIEIVNRVKSLAADPEQTSSLIDADPTTGFGSQ